MGNEFYSLLYPKNMPHFSRINMPRNFYVVLTTPAPLAGMPYPSDQTPWKTFYDSGFSHVVCLADADPVYKPYPLTFLYSAELEDLYHGGSPKDPRREARLIRVATALVIENISRGKGTIIHCAGGTGRTGTIIGCVLKALRFSANDIINYLDNLNRVRGKRGWPESVWQSDFVKSFAYDLAKYGPE